MKKTFKMLALAFVASAFMVSCGGDDAAEALTDALNEAVEEVNEEIEEVAEEIEEVVEEADTANADAMACEDGACEGGDTEEAH